MTSSPGHAGVPSLPPPFASDELFNGAFFFYSGIYVSMLFRLGTPYVTDIADLGELTLATCLVRPRLLSLGIFRFGKCGTVSLHSKHSVSLSIHFSCC
jgi:hypothetical protein